MLLALDAVVFRRGNVLRLLAPSQSGIGPEMAGRTDWSGSSRRAVSLGLDFFGVASTDWESQLNQPKPLRLLPRDGGSDDTGLLGHEDSS